MPSSAKTFFHENKHHEKDAHSAEKEESNPMITTHTYIPLFQFIQHIYIYTISSIYTLSSNLCLHMSFGIKNKLVEINYGNTLINI